MKKFDAKLDGAATGVYLITVTPFTESGALDLSSTDRMVDFCLVSGLRYPLCNREPDYKKGSGESMNARLDPNA